MNDRLKGRLGGHRTSVKDTASTSNGQLTLSLDDVLDDDVDDDDDDAKDDKIFFPGRFNTDAYRRFEWTPRDCHGMLDSYIVGRKIFY